MIWLYWNRWRPAVLAVGISLASVAVLVIAAGSVVGSYPVPAPGKAVSGRTGAQAIQPPPPVDPAKARHGMLLMRAAVVASQTVSYRGVQMVAWWGTDGDSSAYLIEVWHRAGGPEFSKGTEESDGQHGSSRSSSAGAVPAAGGELSIAPWMLNLMLVNYQVVYTGSGSASDRSASVVAILRRDGTLAAQFWLDAGTHLPLRREVFDSAGHLVNEGAFIDLRIGDQELTTVPAAGARPWTTQPTASALAGLRAQGWSLPGTLAGNMALVAVTKRKAASGPVIDASYSDGLSVVSVFMQRGELTGHIPGWHQAAIRGQVVYSSQPDERSLAWSARGLVYTVLFDAPPETVQWVVAELPHDQHIGFWQRVGIGLRRMGSWFNPFH